jgi:hypothetical protein
MRRVVFPILVAMACGTSGTELPARAPVGWALGSALAANGGAPQVDLAQACGSTSATFLTELLDTSPIAAKVQFEWGDCVDGGKQVMIAGRVATTHLGPTDLPTSHPYGDDLSMNIELDPAFYGFAQKLGTGKGEETSTQIHVEIASGFIPHVPRPTSTAHTFREQADENLDRAFFQPGFAEPSVGDRVLVMGRWIIDCGHDDFSAELHAISFLAFAHVEGTTTTVRFYYNPYRDTGLYGAKGAPLGSVGDPQRLGEGQPFPKSLVAQVVGLGDGSVDRLRALEYLDATRVSPAEWEVCPPAPSTALDLRYDVVTRSGVSVELAPDPARGCVAIRASIDGAAPVDAKLKTCALPWAYLNEIVVGQVGQPLDLQAEIQKFVSTPDAKARAALDPEAACGEALAGPAVDPAPGGGSIRVDDGQPFPFYGVVTVAAR